MAATLSLLKLSILPQKPPQSKLPIPHSKPTKLNIARDATTNPQSLSHDIIHVLKSASLPLTALTIPFFLDPKDALAVGGEFGILEGRTFALIHPIVMASLFFYTLWAGYLGWQWRRVRTIQNEITELKKQVKPAPVTPEGTPVQVAPSPVELQIQQLTEERKGLLKGSFRDRHFNSGSILLGFGRDMESTYSILLSLLMLQCLSLRCVSQSQDFDFFYFVQQWPGSYCDTKKSCCYPNTGKPTADFGIHGLWPNYEDGSYPSNCDPNNSFNQAKISDLISNMQKNWPSLACPSSNSIQFWTHEWEKHGTCSESVLSQHGYFDTALSLKGKTNLLKALTSAGINPDGNSYSLVNIKNAIKGAIGYTPWIECNVDESGNSQLYQIYLCVDNSGSDLIECPVFPKGKCGSEIEFPSF